LKIKNILIIGGDSKIGKSLHYNLLNKNINVHKTTRKKILTNDNVIYLDLAEENIDLNLFNYHYDVIFFCISNTSISFCENNVEETREINVKRTLDIIKYFQTKGSFLIYFSSNLVFDGNIENVGTNQIQNPTTEYGIQKSILEKELLNYSNIAIIRLTKIIDYDFMLFKQWISSLIKKNEIYPFYDMKMSPVWIDDLVNFLSLFISNPINGIFHVSSISDITYEEAAYYIAKKLNLNQKLIKAKSFKDFDIVNSPSFTSLDINSNNINKFISTNSFETIDKFLFKNNYQ
jgi:dTDP-4-dehydrorhamnose reductase